MGENMWAQICADIENHPNKQRSDETSSLLLPDQDRVSLTDLHSKFAASKKKIEFFLLSKVRFPTFVVRRRNRPAGEGNSEFNRDKPIIRISPPSHVASSDRMIMATSLVRV